MSSHSLTFGLREDDSDDPIVNAALAYKRATSDFLAALALAPGLDQRYDFAGTTVAQVPAMVDQLMAELDPDAAQPALESARRGNAGGGWVPELE